MKTIWYPHGLGAIARGELDWANDILKLSLVTDSYSPDAEHENFSEASFAEVESVGYDVGGSLIPGRSVAVDTSSGTATLSANQVSWDDVTIAARYGIIYESVSGSLVAYVDPELEATSIDGSFTVSWPSGVLRLEIMQ